MEERAARSPARVPPQVGPFEVVERIDRRVPRWALAVISFLLLGGGAAAGTYASYSSSTTNDGTLQSGVLVLSNKKGDPFTATACYSTGGGPLTDVNDNDCDAIVTLDAQAPGQGDSARITLRNEGDIDATAFKVFAPEACVSGSAPSTAYNGVGDLCDDILLTIQQYTSAANLNADIPAGGVCRYGPDLDTNGVCDSMVSAYNLTAFSVDYPDHTDAIALGSLPGGAERFYKVSVQLDPTAGNVQQGLEAIFSIRWRAEQ